MQRKEFRDSEGRLLFYSDPSSNRTDVRDAEGKLLGYLENGKTRDAGGRLIAMGEEAAALFYRPS